MLLAKLEAVTGETRGDTGTYSLRSNTGAVVGNRLFVVEVAPLLTNSRKSNRSLMNGRCRCDRVGIEKTQQWLQLPPCLGLNFVPNRVEEINIRLGATNHMPPSSSSAILNMKFSFDC